MTQPKRAGRMRVWSIIGGLLLGLVGVFLGEYVFERSWIWLAGLWIGWAAGAGLAWLTTRGARPHNR